MEATSSNRIHGVLGRPHPIGSEGDAAGGSAAPALETCSVEGQGAPSPSPSLFPSFSPPMQLVQACLDQRSAKGMQMQIGPCSLMQNDGVLNAHGKSPVMDTGCSFQELIYGFTCGSLVARGVDEILSSAIGAVEETTATGLQEKEHSELDGSDCYGSKLDDGYIQSGEDDSESIECRNVIEDSETFTEDEDEIEQVTGDGQNKFPREEKVEEFDWDHYYLTGKLVKHAANVPVEGTYGVVGAVEGGTTFDNAASRPLVQGWKKRRRVKDGEQRPDQRNPTGMGAIERAMRRYCDTKQEFMFEPIVGLTFDSEAEAAEFYNLYSWEVGFGTRKGSLQKNGRGYQTMRELVCQRQGFDKRSLSKTKGCNCPAMVRLHRTDDDGWFISTFVKQHNHELSATDAEKREWNSHKKIDQSTRDMVKYLRENNITLSKLHIIMGSMFGGMDNIPFTRRSLRSVCSQIATEQRADDIKKTLEIFRKLRSKDPGFIFSVDMDEDGQIKTLIWVDGRSRMNYSCFGDVVTFDTTYTTNLYKMPFGLFVGVNHHFQTTFFGGVLMRDEKAESFAWVFKEFVDLMGGVSPKTILTDQCRAMEIAIQQTMEGTNHLWCRWHVFKDARLELGPIYRKNSAFRDEFHKVISEMYTIDEFEGAWKDLLESYGLEKHHFLVKAYDKRHKWAKAYNKNKFCARMMSTQRSESANHMLKTVVPRDSSMSRFVENLSRLFHTRYTEEVTAEHETKHAIRVKKRCWPVEKHALEIYTSNVYELFTNEIDKAHSYHVSPDDSNTLFRVKHNNAELVQRFKRPEFEVRSINNGEIFECECRLYEHFGMLCCHVLRVFIHLGVQKIPPRHIMQRWTKKAREMIPMELRMTCRGTSTEKGKVLGQTILFGKALEVANKANDDLETRDVAMKYFQMAEKEIDKIKEERQKKAVSIVESESNICSMERDTSSDIESVPRNVYGASGSSAYMSDDDVLRIKAPPIPVRKGRSKTNRYLSLLDITKKKTKKIVAPNITVRKIKQGKTSEDKQKTRKETVVTKITPHCSRCRSAGHDKRRCPEPNLL
ncbi:hypothetical protein BS78_10G250100 [Paspalum vaginatum]|nr:hypothetical protein BS78_10G250100 [Paspalum vaginatum]